MMINLRAYLCCSTASRATVEVASELDRSRKVTTVQTSRALENSPIPKNATSNADQTGWITREGPAHVMKVAVEDVVMIVNHTKAMSNVSIFFQYLSQQA
jgi:hypothetical protein